MKVGDLVRKRWGRIEPHEQGTVGLVMGFVSVANDGAFPMLTGQWALIMYPGHRPCRYRKQEFKVIN